MAVGTSFIELRKTYYLEGAVDMDSELRPRVSEKCTGCGLCESMFMKHPSIKVRKIGSIW